MYWSIRNLSEPGTGGHRGLEAIQFNCATVRGNIVVPMQEPYAKELRLLYDASKIITVDNCQFWDDFDPKKDFQGDVELHMATLPHAIPYSQGVIVSQSFHELLNIVDSVIAKPTILNGKLAPGVADALRALKKNEVHSFFWQVEKVWSR